MPLSHIRNYACYYGHEQLAALATYDLVILQPTHYSAENLTYLKQNQTHTVAYLSIGEEYNASPTSPWRLYDENAQPLYNPAWQTAFVDCRSAEWRAHLLETVIPAIVKRGYQGIFIDTIDVQVHFPITRSGVMRLLLEMRQRFPSLTFVVNRGFNILPNIINFVDGIMFESFSTYHEKGVYAAWQQRDLDYTSAVAQQLNKWRSSRPVLALDYLDHTATNHQAIEKRATDFGFIPYITNWSINQPPHPIKVPAPRR